MCKYLKGIVAFAMIVFFLAGCDNVVDNDGVTVNAPKEQKTYDYMYESRVATFEGENGWLYYFLWEYNNQSNIPDAYVIDAYNLKYDYIDGYVIEVIDEEKKEVVDYINPTVPHLLLNEDYFEEIERILVYFKENEPKETIDHSDIEDISVEELDKDMVVKLFNEAMENGDLPDGKYGVLPESDIVKENMLDGYQWQVGYFIVHGNIVNVNIELIYDDGVYLSDKMEKDDATENEEDIYDIISNIEKTIVEQQAFSVEKVLFDSIKDIDGDRLLAILEEIEKDNFG